MKSLLELYGQQFRNPMPNSDSEDYTTADVFGQMGANKRRAEYDNSLLGMVHNWATGEQRQPVQLPDNAPLMDQMKEAGMRMLNLPNDMAAGGAKTMAHWLGSAGNPEMVEPQDMLAPLGIGAMAGLGGVVPRGAVGSASAGEAFRAYRGSNAAPIANGSGQQFAPSGTPWMAIDADTASKYAMSWADDVAAAPAVYPVDVAFKNPLKINANGKPYYSIDHDGGKTSTDALYAKAARDGHDGLIVRNVLDPPDNASSAYADPTTVYAAIKPGTVRSATTGELLFSDTTRSSLPGLLTNAVDEPKGFTAYHGSPHDYAAERLIRWPDGRTEYIVGMPDVLPDVPAGASVVKDFPLGRQRLDKIGTGEGAQAYGHGLYEAEKEGVAKSYEYALSGEPEPKWVGPSEPTPAQQRVLRELRSTEIIRNGVVDIAALKDELRSSMNYSNRMIHGDGKRRAPASADDIDRWRANSAAAEAALGVVDETMQHVKFDRQGRMYEVRINADPEDFLDWDKPLSQQSKLVRDAVKELRPDEQTVRMISDLEAKEASGAGNYASRMLLARLKKRFGSHALEQDVRGSSIMSDERAAALLRDSGIPGIRYLDQGSRGAGDGSRNYVVFDDALVEILRKYGLLGMIGGGSLLGSSESEASPAGGLFGVP